LFSFSAAFFAFSAAAAAFLSALVGLDAASAALGVGLRFPAKKGHECHN